MKVLIALSVGLAVVVRFRLFAGNASYWYDEAYLLQSIFTRSFAQLLGPIEYIQVAPPAFLWLERVCFLMFGRAEWAMRLPAFLAGLAALGLMLPLARRAVGGSLVWLPVALLGLARNAIGHSCEVKPYSTDLFVAIAVLLCATVLVLDESSRRSRRVAAVMLLAFAAIGPWLSFPAVYSLGGAVAATLVRAARTGTKRDWTLAVSAGILLLGGTASVWYFDARHLYYEGIRNDWRAGGLGGFPDSNSAFSRLAWPIVCIVDIANYGTREMGIPLAILVAIGFRRWARTNRALATAFAVPCLLALAGTYLEKYPLAGRTATFLLPLLWLAAAAGLTELSERFSKSRVVLAMPFILIAPDVVGLVNSLVVPPRPTEARSAFEYVRANQRSEDVIWGSHIEVYYAYFGSGERVFGCTNSPSHVLQSADGGRVWLVDQPTKEFSLATGLVQSLQRTGYVEVDRRNYHGVVVRLMTKN